MMFPKWLTSAVSSLTQRAVQVGLIILAIFAWWRYQSFKRAQQKIGAKKVIDESIKQGKINAAESEKAHVAAAKPGAAERLRADPETCRDCD